MTTPFEHMTSLMFLKKAAHLNRPFGPCPISKYYNYDGRHLWVSLKPVHCDDVAWQRHADESSEVRVDMHKGCNTLCAWTILAAQGDQGNWLWCSKDDSVFDAIKKVFFSDTILYFLRYALSPPYCKCHSLFIFKAAPVELSCACIMSSSLSLAGSHVWPRHNGTLRKEYILHVQFEGRIRGVQEEVAVNNWLAINGHAYHSKLCSLHKFLFQWVCACRWQKPMLDHCWFLMPPSCRSVDQNLWHLMGMLLKVLWQKEVSHLNEDRPPLRWGCVLIWAVKE